MAVTKSEKTLVMMIIVVCLFMNMISVGQADQKMGLKEEVVVFDHQPSEVVGAQKGLSPDKIKWKCISVVSDVYSCVKLYFKEGSLSLLEEMDKNCCKASAKLDKCLPFLLLIVSNYDPQLVRVTCALKGFPF